MYNNYNNNNKHPTQQISNCLRQLMMSWKFVLLLSGNSFFQLTRLLFLDYGVWSKSVCVCVCVCVSLSLSQNSTKDPPRTHNCESASSFWLPFQTCWQNLGYVLHQCYVVIFKVLKESHPLVGFFEFFQNQRITGGFGFFKKIQKMLNWPVLYHFSLNFLRTVGKKHQNWVLWIVLRTLFYGIVRTALKTIKVCSCFLITTQHRYSHCK